MAPAVRSVDEMLARIREKCTDASLYRQRVILDIPNKVTAPEVHIPALVHGRGRPEVC